MTTATAPTLDKQELNDDWNANRLVTLHGHKLRYVGKQWGWMVYDGKRWAQDDTGEVFELARSAVRMLVLDTHDNRLGKDLLLKAYSLGNIGRITAMINLAKNDLRIRATTDQFDTKPWLLNVQNGTINLKTGERHDHTPSDYITKICPVDYNPDAKSELWDNFLIRIMDNDQGLLDYLQRAIGYSLTGITSEKGFFVCYGTGDNGKSTLLEAILHTTGDYGNATRPQTIMVGGGGDIPNDLAELQGARYVCAAEPDKELKLSMSRLKQLTGGDTVKARFLNKEFFGYRPELKMWLATNTLPDVSENGPAVWQRVHVIPFTVQIPEAEKDKELPSKLRADAEAILAYAVEGCRLWQAEGLKEPQAMRDAAKAYREDQDSFAQFLDEQCASGKWVEGGALVARYGEWRRTADNAPDLSRPRIYKECEQHGYRHARSNGSTIIYGLSLKTTEETVQGDTPDLSPNVTLSPEKQPSYEVARTTPKGTIGKYFLYSHEDEDEEAPRLPPTLGDVKREVAARALQETLQEKREDPEEYVVTQGQFSKILKERYGLTIADIRKQDPHGHYSSVSSHLTYEQQLRDVAKMYPRIATTTEGYSHPAP